MKRISFYIFCLFAFFSFEATGQNLSKLIANLSQKSATVARHPPSLSRAECEPDSIHAYGFTSPTDSILGQRQIFRKHGDIATVVYTYEGSALPLYSIDSTTFDAMGRPVFNEYREFNFDSNAVVVEERLFCFAHEGIIQSDYLFAQSILQMLQAKVHNTAAFDSVILHAKSFFTGLMEPEEKTVNVYSPSGQLKEEQIFRWDALGTMSWFPTHKTNYYYTITGRVNYTEEYLWNGLDFTLETTADYTYDTNDSLTTIISTNETTGLPDEKMVMAYDPMENSTSASFFTWDDVDSQWVDLSYISGDYDGQGRLEALEVVFTFFGNVDGTRLEYVYLDNNSCPWYSRIYEYLGDANWGFAGKYYYFPGFITSTYKPKVLEWSVYPNPTESGIWVHLPPNTYLQISTLQGNVLYRGFIKEVKEYFDLKQAPRQVLLTVGQGKAAVSRLILVHE